MTRLMVAELVALEALESEDNMNKFDKYLNWFAKLNAIYFIANACYACYKSELIDAIFYILCADTTMLVISLGDKK